MPNHPSAGYDLPQAETSNVDLSTNDLSPLAFLLRSMRQRYASQDIDGALALARIAAPYLHPRVPAAAPYMELAAIPDADLDAVRSQD